MSECYEPRQIVRQMGKLEKLPPFSTADLLRMEVQPVYVPEQKRVKQPMPLMHMSKRNAQESHDRFAPHIETIKQMRAEGETFAKIAMVIDIKGNVISRYCKRNEELFR